jgi:hypothetical protein
MCRTYSAAAKLRGSKISVKTVAPFACEFFLYASKIEETTNGCGRCACGQTGEALEVVTKGPITQNGKFHERKRVAKNGEDQAQREAYAEAQEKVELP